MLGLQEYSYIGRSTEVEGAGAPCALAGLSPSSEGVRNHTQFILTNYQVVDKNVVFERIRDLVSMHNLHSLCRKLHIFFSFTRILLQKF